MKICKKLCAIVGIGLIVGASTLMGAEKSASDILKHAYRYIGHLDQYMFNAVVQEDASNGKKIIQRVQVEVDRPNKLRVDTRGDIKNRTVYLNHGQFTMFDHDYHYYGQLKTPVSVDKALDYIFEKYGINAPLATLLYSDMDKRLPKVRGKYFGIKEVEGVPCDYVAFKSEGATIHVWIEKGKKPLIKAYAIITEDQGKVYRKDTTVQWKTDVTLPERDFVFVAPKGAEKIPVEPAS